MPVLAPSNITPYDTVETVMNFARVIANDTEISLAGDLLSDTQPSALPLLNLAWREFQDELVDNGVEILMQERILTNFPPNVSNDPASQAWIGWDQCFDGTDFHPDPVLPTGLVEPLKLEQRLSGSYSGFTEIKAATDGLPCCAPVSWLNAWEWRGDGVYFNGANQPLDIRIRYVGYLPDFVPGEGGSFPASATVPILRSAQALAYYVVATFAGGRGSEYYTVVMDKGAKSIQRLLNRTARKKQRANHRRMPYSAGQGCL